MTIELILTIAASDTGPFDLYSDVDGFVTPFETGIAKSALTAGYTSALAPASTTTVRITSTGVCTNSIDVLLDPPTTTTTTTPTPTTTTTTTAYIPPQVITNAVTSIAETQADGNGTPIPGNQTITLVGIAWNTSPDPTNANNSVFASGTNSPYTLTMTGLTPDILYYVRAYVFDGVSTVYGDNVTFTTPAITTTTTTTVFVAPLISTDPVDNILETSADGNGEVVSEGTTTITERGLCWSVLTNPSKSDSYVTSGAGIGAFTQSMGPFLPDTTYYVRAYGEDGSAAYYGNEVSFATNATTTTTTTAEPTTTTTTTAEPTTTTTTTPEPTTTTTTTLPSVVCDETAQAGGEGITEYQISLDEPTGGFVAIQFNPQGVPDKLEIIHNGIKVATSGFLPVENAGPFDNVYGTEPTNVIPTDIQTLSVDQFIGTSKAVAPTREAEFQAETGTSYVLEPSFQQWVWWVYDSSDYTTSPQVVLRVTGPNGTSWSIKRTCPDSLLCYPLTATAEEVAQTGVLFGMTNGGPNSSIGCAQTVFDSYYHDGDSGEPAIGDKVYLDENLTTPYEGTSLFHKLSSGPYIQIVAEGLITAKGSC